MARVARRTPGPVKGKREERAAAARRAFSTNYGSAELNAAAAARMDPLYGAVIVEDDPYAPDGYVGDGWDDSPPAGCPVIVGIRNPRPCRYEQDHGGEHAPRASVDRKTPQPARSAAAVPAMAPRTVAHDGGTLPPCPRCGRLDWATVAGRQWHLDNNPACASFRKPRHSYAGA